MSSKLITPFAAAVAAVAISMLGAGCNPNADSPYANKDFNFLGLYELKPHTYSWVAPYYPTITSDELGGNHDYSGNQVKLLSGLAVYTDY